MRSLLPFQQRFAKPVSLALQPLADIIKNGDISLTDVNLCRRCQGHIQISTKTSTTICRTCDTETTFVFSKTDFFDNGKFSTYDRSPLFRKYLDNFSELVKDPPKCILVKIYEHLSKSHTIHSIRPTTVANTLKTLGLTQFNTIVIRITKIMLQDPIPVLSEALIDRLVLRFDKIVETFNSIRSCALRKKILNFEYLCAKFLLMERRSDLSEMFHLLKTRHILSSADIKLQDCCDAMVESGSHMNWEFTSSI